MQFYNLHLPEVLGELDQVLALTSRKIVIEFLIAPFSHKIFSEFTVLEKRLIKLRFEYELCTPPRQSRSPLSNQWTEAHGLDEGMREIPEDLHNVIILVIYQIK